MPCESPVKPPKKWERISPLTAEQSELVASVAGKLPGLIDRHTQGLSQMVRDRVGDLMLMKLIYSAKRYQPNGGCFEAFSRCRFKKELRQCIGRAVRHERKYSEEEGVSPESVIDDRSADPCELATTGDDRAKLIAVVRGLPDRHREAISRRFGLLGYEPHLMSEIEAAMSLPQTSAVWLVRKSLDAVRSAMTRKVS